MGPATSMLRIRGVANHYEWGTLGSASFIAQLIVRDSMLQLVYTVVDASAWAVLIRAFVQQSSDGVPPTESKPYSEYWCEFRPSLL